MFLAYVMIAQIGTSVIVQNEVVQNTDDACIFLVSFTLICKAKKVGFNAANIEFGHMKSI